jgi:hypothetical protein
MAHHNITLNLTIEQISFLQTAVGEKLQRLIGQGALMSNYAPEWLLKEWDETSKMANQLQAQKAAVEMKAQEKETQEEYVKHRSKERYTNRIFNSY